MGKRKIYLAVQAVLCVALALLFSFAAADICREGSARKAEHPLEAIFTPEIVAERFARLSPVLLIAIAMSAAGLLLGIKDENADRPARDPSLMRDLIVSRVAAHSDEMKKEHALQRRLRLGTWAAFGLCAVPLALFCLDGGHFPKDDAEKMIVSLAAGAFPWMGAGILCLLIGGALEQKSVLRETEAAKARLKAERAEGIPPVEPKGAKAPGKQGAVRAVLLAAALLFILLGVLNGSLRDVLMKAINVCTECIGLG